MMHWLLYGLVTSLFLSPFLFSLENRSAPFEYPKIVFIGFFAAALILGYSRHVFKNKTSHIYLNRLLLILIGLLGTVAASSFFSIDTYLSLWGDERLPSDSLSFLFILTGISFLVTQLQPNSLQLRQGLKVIMLSLTITSIHGILQKLGFDFNWYDVIPALKNEIFATIGQPAVMAMLLAGSAPLLIYLYETENNVLEKRFWILSFLIIHACLYLGATRGPILLNLIFLVGSVIFVAQKSLQARLQKKHFGFFMLFATIAMALVLTNTQLLYKISPESLQKGLMSRVVIWTETLPHVASDPFLGSGPETFSITQKMLQTVSLNETEYWKSSWIKAHNTLVHSLVTTGLFGFLFYLAAIIRALMAGLQSFKNNFQIQDNKNFVRALTLTWIIFNLCLMTSFHLVISQLYWYLNMTALGLLALPQIQIMINEKWRKLYGLLLVGLALLTGLITGQYYINKKADSLLQKSFVLASKMSHQTEAFQLIDEAIDWQPQSALNHCHRAQLILNQILYSAKKPEAALLQTALDEIEQSSQSCIQSGPNRYETHFTRAKLLSALYRNNLINSTEKIFEALEMTRRLAPSTPIVDSEYALLARFQNNEAPFIKYSEAALKLKPDYLPIYAEWFSKLLAEKRSGEISALVERIERIEFKNSEFVPMLQQLSSITNENNLSVETEKLQIHYKRNEYLLKASP